MIVDERLNGPINKSILVLSCRDEEVYLRTRMAFCANGHRCAKMAARIARKNHAHAWIRELANIGVPLASSHVRATSYWLISGRQKTRIFVMAVFGKIRRLHSWQRRSRLFLKSSASISEKEGKSAQSATNLYAYSSEWWVICDIRWKDVCVKLYLNRIWLFFGFRIDTLSTGVLCATVILRLWCNVVNKIW